MTALDQELRTVRQELAKSLRRGEELEAELSKTKVQNVQLNSELATVYRSPDLLVTQMKTSIQNTSAIIQNASTIINSASVAEVTKLKEKLAESHEMLNKQQLDEKEKLQNFQRRYDIAVGDLQSKNVKLQSQYDEKAKGLELAQKQRAEVDAKLGEKDKIILEARNRNSELRSEIQIVRSKSDQLENNFKKIAEELEKSRNERSVAQNKLAECKKFFELAANVARQIENPGHGSPVLQDKPTPPGTSQQQGQSGNPPKRPRRN
ncbi:hypothetical protein Ddc_09676 [Ditylenchus destructor]|nr:hypothetical protein Ddc_09676 [Ditylenchus destructor]